MQYKGEDLDLRVPHGRSQRESWPGDYEPAIGNGRWPRGHVLAGGSEPVWVDEVLLACCNYAFDVAQANGAAEVGLEHLVNALTRVEAAARTLEGRGVREGQLRRESAALIASEIPAANARDAVAPRRSGELEDVLRRAGDLGQRRGVAAGVDDVLWVLLHYGRDLPVVLLLRRLTPDWQRSDWGRPRELPPEPAPRPVPVQLLPNDGMQARMAGIEDGLRMLQAEMASDRKLMVDLIRDLQRDVVAQRGDGASFRSDVAQRLEGLERTVTTRVDFRLPAQLADRIAQLDKAVQGGLAEAVRGTRELGLKLATLEPIGERMATLERSIEGRAEASTSTLGQLERRLATIESTLEEAAGAKAARAVMERLATLEKAVHGGLGEGARNWNNLGQRLTQLETAITEDRVGAHVAPLADRLGSLERQMQASLADAARQAAQLGQGLAAVETTIARRPAAVADLEPVTARLAAIERRLDVAATDSHEQQDAVTSRMLDLRRLVEMGRTEAERVRGDVAGRLAAIETFLVDSPSVDAAVREFTHRLGGIEATLRSGFGESTHAAGHMAERIAAVERMVGQRPAGEDETLLLLEDRLGSIERQLEERGQQALAATSEIAHRLLGLEQRPTATLEPALLVGPVEQRIAGLEASGLAQGQALTASLTEVSTRLEKLEQRILADAVATDEALRGRDQDFDFIYGEIKQLGQSQVTLNSAVSDWRTESKEHFAALADRLDRLQKLAEAPPPPPPVSVATTTHTASPGTVPATGASNGQPLEGIEAFVPAERPQRGFRYWLFGTSRPFRAEYRQGPIKVPGIRPKLKDRDAGGHRPQA